LQKQRSNGKGGWAIAHPPLQNYFIIFLSHCH
jgi:hypothetical protein